MRPPELRSGPPPSADDSDPHGAVIDRTGRPGRAVPVALGIAGLFLVTGLYLLVYGSSPEVAVAFLVLAGLGLAVGGWEWFRPKRGGRIVRSGADVRPFVVGGMPDKDIKGFSGKSGLGD